MSMYWDAYADGERSVLDEVKEQNHEISRLKAELAALRPLAALGERALRGGWYIDENTESVVPYICHQCGCSTFVRAFRDTPINHRDDCPIPALLAQLEAPDA